MAENYAAIAFSPEVRRAQERRGARAQGRFIEQMAPPTKALDDATALFIAERDTFFVASVGADGWPYVQHRGGPKGFLKILDRTTLAFADFSGNRQYVTVGHVEANHRLALILVDFALKRRVKIYARARTVEADEDPALMERLASPDYAANIERAIVLDIEAFDWNCPQHIVPRWTGKEVDAMLEPYQDEIAKLRAALTTAPAQGNALNSDAQVPADWDADGKLTTRVVVQGLRQLTPRVRAFTLAAPDGQPLPPFAAGAHIQVPVRLADGILATRSYSLTNLPLPHEATQAYEIAVLREDDGEGGSAYLHDMLQLGATFRVGLPYNGFPLADQADHHVLIAGGIGITPILAMAHALHVQGASFELHYAARSQAEAAFYKELHRAFPDRLTFYPSTQGKRLAPAPLLVAQPDGTHAYVCGPVGLIDDVRAASTRAGWANERVHAELFVAEAHQPDDQPVTVELARSGQTVYVEAEETILEAAEASGVLAPFSCRTGTCRTCAVRVLVGQPDHRDHVLSDAEKAAGDVMTICVSRAHTDHLTLDL